MSDNPRVPSAWQLERAVSAWQQLRATFAADEDLVVDESAIVAALADADITHPETLLERVIDAVVWADLRDVEADELRKEMTERRDRYRARAEALRALIRDLMGALEITSHAGKLAKASIAAGPASVVITDEQLLPAEYFRVHREPNRTLIREHIDNGVIVPGAVMSNAGAPVLRIVRPRKARQIEEVA